MKPQIRARNWRFPLFCLAIIAVIIIKALISGEFGRIGQDSDDIMRLVQIRDYLGGGQSWFDTNQYRMGPSGGTDMHWSRLVDIPLIYLISFFDLFLPYMKAEALAVSIWPPLSSAVALLGIFTGAKYLGGRKAAWCAAFIAGLFLFSHYRFSPGAIDHHNIQIGLICLAAGLVLNPKYDPVPFLFGGISLGLAVAIGTEVYIFAGIICLFVAALWLFKGDQIANGVAAFGLGLSGALAFSFFSVISPSEYGKIYCDSLSYISVTAGVIGGAGLALLTILIKGRSIKYRAGALVGLGLMCGLFFISQAPHCLSNPLSDLPDDVKTLWLENIEEAKPLFHDKEQILSLGIYGLGVALIGIFLCVRKVIKGIHAPQYAFMAAMLLASTFLALHQARFFVFGQFLSFMVTAVWVYELYARNENQEKRKLGYIGALALSLPLVWALPGLLIEQSDTAEVEAEADAETQAGLCYSDPVLDFMKTLPTGQVLVGDIGAVQMLLKTPHSVLGGNYHRNVTGIQQSIKITTASPEMARSHIADTDLTYVLFCRTSGETSILRKHSPDGLIGALYSDDVPDYLTAVKTLEDGLVTVYKITQN